MESSVYRNKFFVDIGVLVYDVRRAVPVKDGKEPYDIADCNS